MQDDRLKYLAELLRKLPDRYELHVGVERDNGGDPYLCATLMESPPEGGWRSRGAYFRHPRDCPSHLEEVHPADKHATACREGITTEVDDAESFARLLVCMIEDRVAKGAAR